jgi:hypothetical protein
MSGRAGDETLRCPSAQPGMADVQVLGVATGSADKPRIAYLNAHLPATDDVLAAAAPVPVTQVFRLAARCEERRCTHFDGHKCQLAVRIVEMLDEVTEALPPCVIRRTCRWFAQEGRAACLRCPQILTQLAEPDDRLRRVAGIERATAMET